MKFPTVKLFDSHEDTTLLNVDQNNIIAMQFLIHKLRDWLCWEIPNPLKILEKVFSPRFHLPDPLSLQTEVKNNSFTEKFQFFLHY